MTNTIRLLPLYLALAVIVPACAPTNDASAPPPTAPEGTAPAVTDPAKVIAEADPKSCLGCHGRANPGIVTHYVLSEHFDVGTECIDCHGAGEQELDAWQHEGMWIGTIVTPNDCAECHDEEAEQFQASHHSKAGNILHSLDNLLAEEVEGFRGSHEMPNPHDPSKPIQVNGLAFANSGCHQCHGSQVALMTTAGTSVTPWKLKQPEGGGKAVVTYDAASIDKSTLARGKDGRPIVDTKTWPNTGIGRMNLDGSRGSCSACHSRHDFSSRRARRPENCGKCHLGPDHPQKEIYEESKHGIAYRDLVDEMNLDAETWVLGKDYNAAPTCATCHMSATTTQPITHDPRERISWTNRPPVSLRMNTNEHGETIKPGSKEPIANTWEQKRDNMKNVCSNCHTPGYVDAFYDQYDDFINLYNEKYGKPGLALMKSLKDNGLLSKPNFDEKIEWTWFYLWHHEGRRGRHGVAMMAPDYAHWHGTYEVADRWYNEFIPEMRELIAHAKKDGAKKAGAKKAEAVLNEIMSRVDHRYPTTGERAR